MPDDTWTTVAHYPDRISAEAILGLLATEQLPCFIASNEHVPGLGSAFSVRVPSHVLRQAQWLLEQSRVSENELTELALREPSQESEND